MTDLFDKDYGKAAVFSPCLLYRYRLIRGLGHGTDSVNIIMLNPSTANAVDDDPTIIRCRGFYRGWYADLDVTNLFALRSTDPKALYVASDPVGPENDRHILDAARSASLVICAWGTHGALHGRDAHVTRMLTESGINLYCLALTKDGHPGHPLRLPKDSQQIPFHGGTCRSKRRSSSS